MAKRDQSKGKQADDEKKSTKGGGRGAWKVLDRGSTVVAAILAREASQMTWRAATGRKPPAAGRHPEVDAKEAVAWAIVGGALVELVKLLVRRWAADYWVRSTGKLPPGMKPIKPSVVPVTPEEPAPVKEPAPLKRARSRRRRAS